MASTDGRPVPIKNVAYRVTFPIWDGTGALVTGATGLDSEISKDGGTFADCTNEATEIATASGIYFLDLSSTEMNADTVAVIVKTTTSGAKTTPLILYPNETGDIDVDLTAWLGTAAATPTVAGVPEVDVTHFNGSAGVFASGRPEVNASHVGGTSQTGRDLGASVLLSSGTGTGQLDVTSGVPKVNLTQILGTALTETAGLIAAGFKKFFNVVSPTGTINSLPDAVPDAVGGLPVTGTRLTAIPWNSAWDAEVQSEAADALTAYDPPTNAEMEARTIAAASYATATALDAVDNFLDTEIADIQGRLPAALDGGRMASNAQVVGDKVGYTLSAEGLGAVHLELVDVLTVDTYTEPGQGAPPMNAALVEKIGFLYKAWRNLTEQDATGYRLFNDAGTVVDQKAAISEAGGTTTSGEIVSGP